MNTIENKVAAVPVTEELSLVRAAKQGDDAAFEELVRRYDRNVFRIAQHITQNREDAEDVVQESFHKAFLHLAKFQERSQFSTWLTRIAMNEALMVLRRRRGDLEVLPESPDDSGRPTPEAFVDHSPSPEESCWRRERKQLLAKAINRLGPKIRRTIFLRHIEERSAEETAEILGTSIGAVKARVFQGRRKLRRIVNPGLRQGVYAVGRVAQRH